MMIFPSRARRFMFKCRRAAEEHDVVPCEALLRWSQLDVPYGCPPTSSERPSCFNLRFQKKVQVYVKSWWFGNRKAWT